MRSNATAPFHSVGACAVYCTWSHTLPLVVILQLFCSRKLHHCNLCIVGVPSVPSFSHTDTSGAHSYCYTVFILYFRALHRLSRSPHNIESAKYILTWTDFCTVHNTFDREFQSLSFYSVWGADESLLDRLALLSSFYLEVTYLLKWLPYMAVGSLVHCQVCTCSLLRTVEVQSTCGQFEWDGYGVWHDWDRCSNC